MAQNNVLSKELYKNKLELINDIACNFDMYCVTILLFILRNCEKFIIMDSKYFVSLDPNACV